MIERIDAYDEGSNVKGHDMLCRPTAAYRETRTAAVYKYNAKWRTDQH